MLTLKKKKDFKSTTQFYISRTKKGNKVNLNLEEGRWIRLKFERSSGLKIEIWEVCDPKE